MSQLQLEATFEIIGCPKRWEELLRFGESEYLMIPEERWNDWAVLSFEGTIRCTVHGLASDGSRVWRPIKYPFLNGA